MIDLYIGVCKSKIVFTVWVLNIDLDSIILLEMEKFQRVKPIFYYWPIINNFNNKQKFNQNNIFIIATSQSIHGTYKLEKKNSNFISKLGK